MNNPVTTGNKQEGKPRTTLFKKGQSGNPNGRPPGTFSIMTLVKKAMQEQAVIEGKKADKTYADLFVRRLLSKTITEGDGPLMKVLIEQVDGAPSRKVDITTGGEPINAFGADQMRRIAAELLNNKGKA